ncbi:hypothetical protein D3C72_928920 [compost metagenome]
MKLDELDSHIFSKINKSEELRLKRRELKINVSPYVFINKEHNFSDDSIIGLGDVERVVISNEKENLDEEEFRILIAIIEGTANLKRKKDRNILEDGKPLTKGKVLSIIQNKQAVFDIEQKKAALNIIDSPQRIRGLAGSGKTIILTMKVALYHLQNPEAEILYTYFTKALYGQVKYLVEKFYRDFSENREPDWNKIHILHGWGGKGLRGVYSDTCFENDINPISFSIAKSKSSDAFNYIFEQLNKSELKQKYDLTLIDEGQDFPKSFYRICRKITKNDRLVWAYDDFQNIFDVDIQDEKKTFGTDEKGDYYVDFSRNENKLQDIVLHKCYRNPRFALTTAFALGLGIYNEKVLQRLENNKHWEDLGFVVEKGESKDNDDMVISRPESNSPFESNEYFTQKSINIDVFESLQEECSFVINAIINDIKENELRADDICVISLDAKHIGVYFDYLSDKLREKGIQVFNLLQAANNNTSFSIENHVTLSTINRAKGNEKGMVYVVGVDAIFLNRNFIIDRNKLFTAITRSKGWVNLTGTTTAKYCEAEINKLRENDYKLVFKQPNIKETRTILRGMTQQQSFLNEILPKIESFSKTSGLSAEEIIAILATQNNDKK